MRFWLMRLWRRLFRVANRCAVNTGATTAGTQEEPQQTAVWVHNNAVFLTWRCRECQRDIAVNPDFVSDSGIPLCDCAGDCAGDSDDMVYIGASIMPAAINNHR